MWPVAWRCCSRRSSARGAVAGGRAACLLHQQHCCSLQERWSCFFTTLCGRFPHPRNTLFCTTWVLSAESCSAFLSHSAFPVNLLVGKTPILQNRSNRSLQLTAGRSGV